MWSRKIAKGTMGASRLVIPLMSGPIRLWIRFWRIQERGE